MVVYGFKSKISALSFEWHWQYPPRSSLLTEELSTLKLGKSFKAGGLGPSSGVVGKMAVAMALLRCLLEPTDLDQS